MKKILLFCLVCIASQANAAKIVYEAVDLTDTTAGQDLWQYNYSVSGNSFAINHGFSIFFDPSKYSSLQDPAPSVNSDWDILTLQPDVLLPDDGIYDALALVANPSLQDKFTLTFVWLGTGTPGSQPFELYDDSFNIIGVGNTVSNVPLPAAFPLFGSGLLMLFGIKKKSKLGFPSISFIKN